MGVTMLEVQAMPEKNKEFVWDNTELKEFWDSCFPLCYDSCTFDGLHPKALCSKIFNNVLKLNVNSALNESNPEHRAMTLKAMVYLEDKLVEGGIIQKPMTNSDSNITKVYK